MKQLLGLGGLLMLLVSVAGCQFYGYPGGVTLTLAQIEAANEQVAQDIEQAVAELEVLRLLARRDETLASYVAQYEAVLEAHQQAVLEFEHWKEQVAAHPDDYRQANQTLGAITARHEALLQQYADIAWTVVQHVNPALLARSYTSAGPRFFFYVLPPQYARQVNAQAILPLQVVRYLASQVS